MKKALPLLVIAVLVIFLWASYHPKAPNPSLTASVGTTVAKAGASALYPNSTLTPGDVLTTDSSVVCVPGYSSGVRNVPLSEKRQVYAEYDTPYPQPQGSYEVDHFISLELGGSNDVKNLWPEPASPKPGFHEKDVVENYLHQQVCTGAMPLAEAQREIRTDWYAVYLRTRAVSL